MKPTKRQIAKVLRKTSKVAPEHAKLTAALFDVCRAHNSKASAYYDSAVKALKAYFKQPFTKLLTLPLPDLQKTIRSTARALEHGLHI